MTLLHSLKSNRRNSTSTRYSRVAIPISHVHILGSIKNWERVLFKKASRTVSVDFKLCQVSGVLLYISMEAHQSLYSEVLLARPAKIREFAAGNAFTQVCAHAYNYWTYSTEYFTDPGLSGKHKNQYDGSNWQHSCTPFEGLLHVLRI